MELQHELSNTGNPNTSKLDIVAATADNYLPACKAFAQELYHNPVDSLEHAGVTLAKSAAIGALVGYVIPARGPAAAIVAAGFMIPMAISAYRSVDQAQSQAQKGESLDKVSKALALNAVEGTYNFGLNMAGGVGGTWAGVKLATSDTALAVPGQALQRLVMKGENSTMNLFRSPVAVEAAAPKALLPLGKITTLAGKGDAPVGMVDTQLDAQLAGKPGLASALERPPIKPIVEKTGLAARLDQHQIVNLKLGRQLKDGPDGENQMYFGSLHGHSNRSDGLGEPRALFQKAAEEGQQVTTLTEHSHAAARMGVPKGDPRAADEQGVPIITSDPIEYSQEFADAAATTTDTHLSLVGSEIGTIGKVGGGSRGGGDGGSTGGGHGGHPGKGGGRGGRGVSDEGGPEGDTPTGAAPTEGIVGNLDPAGDVHDHDLEHHSHGMMNPERVGATNPGGKPFNLAEAREGSLSPEHLGGMAGVNHIGLLEVPTFFETVKQPAKGAVASIMRLVGREPEPVVTAPEVFKFNDGDYKSMVDHLDGLKASDGGSPIIALNHPRYLADNNPNTPAAMRSRDYGQKSFANHQEWLDRFATPYVRQIELIKGGALNPNPVDTVPTGMLDPKSFAGYINDGVHASPSFGRDFHFGDPVGNPGATGIYSPSLAKGDILNALRQRRTIATTSSKNLSGVLTANDGSIMMGAIVDHSVTPGLNLSMRVDGIVDPEAKYSVKLWGDTSIGDGKLAEIVQQKDVTGSELLAANQTVAFDPVKGTTGKNSAYYVEVNRTDGTSDNVDKMWTAPIWLENLAGTEHTVFSKLLNGQLSQLIPNPFQSNIPVAK